MPMVHLETAQRLLPYEKWSKSWALPLVMSRQMTYSSLFECCTGHEQMKSGSSTNWITFYSARTTSGLHVEPNPNEISETAWVTQTELQEWLDDPKETRGIIAPWFRLIAENILPEWWGNLDGLLTHADHLIRDMGEVKMRENRQSPDDSKLGVLTA